MLRGQKSIHIVFCIFSDRMMKSFEMAMVLLGLIMALYSQPALCSADAEGEAEGENGANSMMMFSVPAMILSALLAKLMH